VRFAPTELPDVIVVEPDIHRDGRGFFLETYHAEKYRGGGIGGRFVRDNHSQSVAGTIRGLHLQLRRRQGKLIRVIEGEIFDVAVDVRRGSPTFGRWVGVTISADNLRQCYVPPGPSMNRCCRIGIDAIGRWPSSSTSCRYGPASERGRAPFYSRGRSVRPATDSFVANTPPSW
jgi:hypothetical protein